MASEALSPRRATELIRGYAAHPDFAFIWTRHAKEQMAARDIFSGDVLYVLRGGFVYSDAVAASRGFSSTQSNRALRILATVLFALSPFPMSANQSSKSFRLCG